MNGVKKSGGAKVVPKLKPEKNRNNLRLNRLAGLFVSLGLKFGASLSLSKGILFVGLFFGAKIYAKSPAISECVEGAAKILKIQREKNLVLANLVFVESEFALDLPAKALGFSKTTRVMVTRDEARYVLHLHDTFKIPLSEMKNFYHKIASSNLGGMPDLWLSAMKMVYSNNYSEQLFLDEIKQISTSIRTKLASQMGFHPLSEGAQLNFKEIFELWAHAKQFGLSIAEITTRFDEGMQIFPSLTFAELMDVILWGAQTQATLQNIKIVIEAIQENFTLKISSSIGFGQMGKLLIPNHEEAMVILKASVLRDTRLSQLLIEYLDLAKLNRAESVDELVYPLREQVAYYLKKLNS